MSLKLVLPPPPKVYTPEYERVRNRELERLINSLSNSVESLYLQIVALEARVAALESP